MKAQRRRHEPEFKARVALEALEALKGVQIIQEIAKNFDIHPMQITDWKKAMAAGASSVFGAGRAPVETEDFERQRGELHAKIGPAICLRQRSPRL